MFEVNNLSIIVDNKYLVHNLSFHLNKNDKLAIIGEEGNGKTTLLKVLAGRCDYATVTGTVQSHQTRISYLPQNMPEDVLEETGYQYLFHTDDDYYHKVNQLYRYLRELKIKDSLLEETIKNMSGGEKIKIGLLKILLEEADILLLDEPTNDLDLDALNWLEDFICYTDRPIIYVSHDETLLEKTANRILHLEQVKRKQECRHTLLKTDYRTYVEQRLQELQKQTQQAHLEKREYEKKRQKLLQVMQKVEYQQNTISRSDPHGARLLKKKMHALKAQEQKIEKQEITEVPSVEEQISFHFEEVNLPRTKAILQLSLPILKVANHVLARNLELTVRGPEHICIIGKNGAGKTTLLHVILEELKKRNDLKVGYMPQNYEEVIQEEESVIDFASPSSSKEDRTKTRMYLGNVNITTAEMEGKMKDLSNGSKAKVFLIHLVLLQCDVLLLDEPTRNVSPLSNPMIRKVLKNYKGAIISVSHDRKYIDEVTTKQYLLQEDGLIEMDKRSD